MKKNLLTALAASAALLLALPAFAWDGVVSAKLVNTDVAPGGNYGFRIILAGSPIMCTGGPNWAYLNDTDSNYKTFVAVLLMAKAQNTNITVFSTLEGGYCHIGYVSSGNQV
jgi:hypothetical protein